MFFRITEKIDVTDNEVIVIFCKAGAFAGKILSRLWPPSLKGFFVKRYIQNPNVTEETTRSLVYLPTEVRSAMVLSTTDFCGCLLPHLLNPGWAANGDLIGNDNINIKSITMNIRLLTLTLAVLTVGLLGCKPPTNHV